MANYNPAKLIEYIRDGLIEQEHSGFIVKLDKKGVVTKIGDEKNYPFYLRSCAKPLQAALIIDYALDEFYALTNEEIAIFCASHAGEICHTHVVKTFLDKIGLDESYLKCGLHKPISKTEQNKLIKNAGRETILQNNCSGKHAMMLGICKKMGWDLNNYDELDHPLQQAIKSKIYDLCELKQEYQITKDGCGVPIHSMPLEKMLKGYMNLFFNQKYEKIKNAFMHNPYLIGGEDRLDTAIMTANPKLIAKVGAGGLCIILNTQTEDALIVKIMDCDMKARAIVLIEALSQLEWLDQTMIQNPLVKEQHKKDILTLHLEKIGEIKTLFSL